MNIPFHLFPCGPRQDLSQVSNASSMAAYQHTIFVYGMLLIMNTDTGKSVTWALSLPNNNDLPTSSVSRRLASPFCNITCSACKSPDATTLKTLEFQGSTGLIARQEIVDIHGLAENFDV